MKNRIFKRRFLEDNNPYYIIHKLLREGGKPFTSSKEKLHFHKILINTLIDIIQPIKSSVNIFYHNRKDGNKWKSVDNTTTVMLRISKQLEFLADEHSVHRIWSDDPLLIQFKSDGFGPKVKQGLLFQFFNDYDYLVFSNKIKDETINLLSFLKSLVFELQLKIESHSKIGRLEKKVESLNNAFTKSEASLRETERSLKRRVYEIHNLFEISSELYSILDFEQLINSALLTIVGQIGCQKTFAMLYDSMQRKYSRFYTKGFGDDEQEKIEIEIDHPVISFLLKRQRPLLVEDLYNSKNLMQLADGFKKNEIEIIAPIIHTERVKGIIGCGAKLYGGAFDKSDLQIFAILVNIISISISNAQMYENVKKMSFTDAMTNLNNYRYFENRMKEEINRARRNKSCVSLIMLDIDRFKNYNDTLGHQAGDEALRSIGWILKNTARDDDIVNRYGGEEFSIILPGLEKKAVYILAERIRKNIEEYPFYKGHIQPGGRVTVSLGAAAFPDDAEDFEDLVSKADQALYKSKKMGRNRFTLFEPDLQKEH